MTHAVRFELLATAPGPARARLGRVHTPHGSFDTPAFMPVGTRGSVKGVLPHLLARTGAQICLANTYHLLLRPGSEVVARLGGLHAFMNWPRPILTDSGGYQAYSMADLNAVDDDGVTFKSIVDGSMVRLTPERAIAVQNQLGADIIMAFDDCPPSVLDRDAGSGEGSSDPRLSRATRRDRVVDHAARLRVANERTIRWLERCASAHARAQDQALFGIVQGGTDLDARTWSAQRVTGVDLPGYAIGGVAVGEEFDDIRRVVEHTAPLLPEGTPRYLMGVGYERDLLAAVRAGVDMFDCVLPTRNGRNANAFTPTGQIRLRNAGFAEDRQPIEPGCDCSACAGEGPDGRPFSRAYLRHLFMAGEMLGPILVSLHNLRYFQRFMRDVRAAIPTGDWAGVLARYPVADAEPA
ncbi:MAG: tRNA guanosine transglycosylase [Phycisphaerales bacterium]